LTGTVQGCASRRYIGLSSLRPHLFPASINRSHVTAQTAMSVPSQSYTNWLSLLNPSSPRRPRNETLSHLATLNNAQAPELSLDTLDTRDLLLPSGVKLRSYNSPSPSAIILHIHGGGWGTGDLDSEDRNSPLPSGDQR